MKAIQFTTEIRDQRMLFIQYVLIFFFFSYVNLLIAGYTDWRNINIVDNCNQLTSSFLLIGLSFSLLRLHNVIIDQQWNNNWLFAKQPWRNFISVTIDLYLISWRNFFLFFSSYFVACQDIIDCAAIGRCHDNNMHYHCVDFVCKCIPDYIGK